jgi:hypothetical protein
MIHRSEKLSNESLHIINDFIAWFTSQPFYFKESDQRIAELRAMKLEKIEAHRKFLKEFSKQEYKK